ESARLILTALEEGTLKAAADGSLFGQPADEEPTNPLGEEAGTPKGALTDVSLNNQSRRVLGGVLSRMRLTAKNVEIRRTSARKLSEYPEEGTIVLIRDLYEKETDEETRAWMGLALAKVDLKSDDPKLRI